MSDQAEKRSKEQVQVTRDNTPTMAVPSMEELEEWASDSGCCAIDGCWVEPDGTCEHDHPSWLLYLGWI